MSFSYMNIVMCFTSVSCFYLFECEYRINLHVEFEWVATRLLERLCASSCCCWPCNNMPSKQEYGNLIQRYLGLVYIGDQWPWSSLSKTFQL